MRTFAAYGYAALCPNLFHRYAPGAKATDAAAAATRPAACPTSSASATCGGAADSCARCPSSNGRVGVIGYCSGGRQAYVVACSLDIDAAVDCYGGRVVAAPEDLTPARPVAPIDLTPDLQCPLLGLFGARGHATRRPSRPRRSKPRSREHGKTYEFHTFENAGHAFFSVDRPNYSVDAAKEGWKLIWDFFGRHLQA